MWRHINGVENPKRKQTPEDKKQRDKEYEAKRRKWVFLEEWKQDRPRLQFDSDSQSMYCTYCIKAGVGPEKPNFVKGCTNIKFETIKSHQLSNFHLFSTNKHLHDQNPKEAPARRSYLDLYRNVSDKLKILFSTVHALNVKAHPLTDYKYITEMDVKKGLCIPGDTYKSVHSCKEFMQAIADVEMEKIKERFNQSKFVAVIVDGSMDSSIVDNEIVFMQTCISGEIQTDFLRCCHVQRGNAAGIMKAIERAANKVAPWDEFSTKLVALGSDGASVMLGKKNGVIALLQQEKSNVIGIHCCGHRLELAYKDALKVSPLAEKVATLLSGLYYFYRNSALNRTNLKGAYNYLGLKILLPTRANGTRWVSHVSRALDHFVKDYKAFCLHFEQLVKSKERGDSKAKAQGFLKMIKAHDIVAMALLLQDILFVLKKVSLKFQEENSVVADMALAIKTTISQLQLFKSRDGPYFH